MLENLLAFFNNIQFAIYLGVIAGLCFACIKWRKECLQAWKDIEELKKKNILEDLSLATTDQLIEEMRKRPTESILITWDGKPRNLRCNINNMEGPKAKAILEIISKSLEEATNETRN